METRLGYMDENWKKFQKKPKESNTDNDEVPAPSAHTRTEDRIPEENQKPKFDLTIGQKIFRTKWTCPGIGKPDSFIFKTWITEFLKYFLFLLLLTVCTFSYTNSDSFYLTNAMKSIYMEDTGFHDISTEEQIWQWLEDPFLKAVYESPIEYNEMATPPRLRMQRVKPQQCALPSVVINEDEICYPEYKKSNENKDPLVPTSNLPPGTGYTEIPGSIFGFDYWGQALPYLRMYWAGGYLLHLPVPDTEQEREIPSAARDLIQSVKELDWLGGGARILLVDLQLYNKNVNLFSIIRMSFEIPSTGGVITQAQFSIIHVYSSSSPLDVVTVICEIAWLILIGYYIGEKIYEMKVIGFRNFMGHLELRTQFFNLLLSSACVIFKMVKYSIIDSDEIMICDPAKENDCYLSNFVFWQNQFNNFLAIVTFLSWIELNKFFTDFESTAVFTKTLRLCLADLVSFMLVFTVTYLAYAELGVLIFGGQLDQFKNIFHSIYTLFRVILGDFDFHALESSNRILGPIYFITYVFVVFFILLNMFIAIISDTYSEVKAELSVPGENRFPVSDYMASIKSKLWSKLGVGNNSGDNEMSNAFKSMKDTTQIDWESFRLKMLQSGLAEEEIQRYFAKYDTDGDTTLGKKEFARLEESLMRLRKDPDTISQKSHQSTAPISAGEVLGQAKEIFADVDNFDLLRNRVAKMESAFADLTSKVDGIIVKLDQLGQRQKQARIDQHTAKTSGSKQTT